MQGSHQMNLLYDVSKIGCCRFCGCKLIEKRGKHYCNRTCHMRHRGLFKRNEQPPIYSLSELTMAIEKFKQGIPIKKIAFSLGSSCYKKLKRSLRFHGIWIDRPRPQRTKKPFNPCGIVKEHYSKEEFKLLQLDNIWVRHKAVGQWKSHWKDKSLSAQRARLRYSRHKHNPMFRIRASLRLRVWKFLKKRDGLNGSSRTMRLLGCDLVFLKNHLQSRFTEDMTWLNYGKWEIDHIKPCTAFNLMDESQQNECFHWSNLQPLWKVDNIIKGAVWVTPSQNHSQTDKVGPFQDAPGRIVTQNHTKWRAADSDAPTGQERGLGHL